VTAVLTLALPALAQDAGAPPESRASEQVEVGVRPNDRPGNGLTFLGVVQTKVVATNVTSTNPFLDGQVVGVLGGTNDLTTGEERSVYAEQRLGTFFGFAPPILDGDATLNAAFEVDFGWGDRSYGLGGNTGGGFGADMVNLQTRRFEVATEVLRGDHDLTVHTGLQFVPDGPFDPTRCRPDDLFRTSGRLLLFGSEAAGISAYGTVGGLGGTVARYRVGAFTLWESGLGEPDDTTLHVADVRVEPTWTTGFGAHAFWMRDRSGGTSGALGIGPLSALSELQGGPRLDVREDPAAAAPPVDVDLLWLVLDGGWNHRLDRGPVSVTGVAIANVGAMYVEELEDRAIRGLLVDGEARARWAPGEGSVARAEVRYTTADDPDDPDYTGVMTGNTWGLVGALDPTHGTLLLMPDPFSINRYTGVIHDPSNGGAGALVATGSVGWDPVPNRVTATVGGGWGSSGGETVGTELNLHLVAEAFLFFKVGLHAGRVFGTSLPTDPTMAYLSLDWLVFP
jgi:hypothetical protein